MDGPNVADNQSTVDADGVLYLTAGSSGGKFYESDRVKDRDYVAYTYYEHRQVALHFAVTDNSLALTTYFADDLSVLDTYTLAKSVAAPLNEAIARAEVAISESTNKLPASYQAPLESLLAEARAMLDNIDSYSAEQILAVVDKIQSAVTELEENVEYYSKLSPGASPTGADSANNVSIIHLPGGTYTMTSGGTSGKTNIIYRKNEDGTSTEFYKWTEGKTSSHEAPSNPYVCFKLDDNVTFDGQFAWYFSNVIIDLCGKDLTLQSTTDRVILMGNAGSLEIRGTGRIIWGAASGSTNLYLIQGNHYYTKTILNGDITVIDKSPKGRYLVYEKGMCDVHGTLTIDKSYDTTTGYAFYVQGSRSNGDDRGGIISVENATINYNVISGAPLFYAKGVSGVYNGDTYSSFGTVRIKNSRLNLKAPLATSVWGSGSASGKVGSNSLTNCVNATKLIIEDSYIYADFYYKSGTALSAITLFAPSGYADVSINNSTIYTETGTMFSIVASASNRLDITAENSTFYSGTTQAEAGEIGTALGWTEGVNLQGIMLSPNGNAKGKAVFNNCTLSAQYRIANGTSESPGTATYFVEVKNSRIIVDTANGGGGHVVVRGNMLIDSCEVNCGSGGLAYMTLPYNPETGVGVLVRGATKIINFQSSKIDSYVKSIEYYQNANVYETVLESGHFTIENNTKFVSFTHASTSSSRASFELVRVSVEDFKLKSNILLYTDFTYNLYIPANVVDVKSITIGGTVYSDISALMIEEIDNEEYYCIPVQIGLTEAGDDIVITVVVIDSDGTEITGKWTVSVVKYLEKVLLEYDDKITESLAKDILSYIRAAYVYVKKDNGVVEKIDGIIGEGYDSTSVPNTEIPKAEITEGLYSAALKLDTAPAFIFRAAEGYTNEMYVFTSGNTVLDAAEFVYDGVTYMIVSLPAFMMTDTVEYSIVGTDISGEYNLAAYYEFVKRAGDTDAVALVERIWRYSESAKLYRSNVNN